MKIYWDHENQMLLSSLSTAQQLAPLAWILRDQKPVSLYLVTFDEDTQAYVVGAAPTGFVPKFGIKKLSAFAAGPLAYQGTWTLTGAGETSAYTATVDLNTAELIAELADADAEDLVAEFVLQDASGNNRDSTQIVCAITQDVNRVADPAPTSLDAWPWMEEFVKDGHRCLRFKNSDGVTLLELTPPGV